jgi:hypothetical protein
MHRNLPTIVMLLGPPALSRRDPSQLFVFDELDVIELSPETAGVVVVERYRGLRLQATFAFKVVIAIWVALVAPPMHADPAQKSPHGSHGPPATRAVKGCR